MTIQHLLKQGPDNFMLPFLWIHGESEEVYRSMVKAIYDANIRAFCIEARPHEEFCKELWWHDLDILLDEAEKRGMKVWILDDKHFPTGYAAGAAENAPAELRRQGLLNKHYPVKNGHITLDVAKKCHADHLQQSKHARTMYAITNHALGNYKPSCRFNDDRILSVTAVRKDRPEPPMDLSACVRDGVLDWDAPEGRWEVQLCFLSRNIGDRRSYINMMDKASCRLQIDAVYEPHYARYKDKFGTVIAGFFSDEPNLGNNYIYRVPTTLGQPQDLPWSRELEEALCQRLGEDFAVLLPLLWSNDCDAALTARVRYIYMDCVTRLVERDFSHAIGDWCRERGVEYIGHIIEDDGQHARTGCSLGHFYRGLMGQDWAGIDCIGSQVYPGGEDFTRARDPYFTSTGEFFHYALGKLGSSMGQLVPRMQNRTMCELFGNYGWGEGLRLEKYLLDHFMVRGVNRFVPHAFTCKAFPDPDCPPHFYAHGHNPQYRHFGRLMLYGNRVCRLLEGGTQQVPVAILYHAEAEWTGRCMPMEKAARILWDMQVDFHYVPSDVFAQPDWYHTEIGDALVVNGYAHRLLVIPTAQFITKETAEGICRLRAAGGTAVFLDELPQGLCTGEPLPQALADCPVIPLNELAGLADRMNLRNVRLSPETNRIRVLHQSGKQEAFYLFNEDTRPYTGTVQLPSAQNFVRYDAWENRLVRIAQQDGCIPVTLAPSESLILIGGACADAADAPVLCGKKTELTAFDESVCRSIDYPAFGEKRPVEKLQSYHLTDPAFSGFIRYETRFVLEEGFRFAALEITDAYEGVEVFVNGQSAGIQILPPFRYDLSALCHPGSNTLAIEVATTLHRQCGDLPYTRANTPDQWPLEPDPTGITGQVYLYWE